MIVYAFAWRREGYSPCNIRLAQAAKRIIAAEKNQVLVFAEGSIALILKELRVESLAFKQQGHYGGSEAVTQQAAEIFRDKNIRKVIPVANPILHLTKCMLLVHKEGYNTPSFLELTRHIGWIGFDPESEQPWTRDPFRLIFYTARQIFLGYKPPPEMSEP